MGPRPDPGPLRRIFSHTENQKKKSSSSFLSLLINHLVREMPSKPVTAAKEEDRLVSTPSLARLSSLAELQRDTPAATRAINDGFNYTVKSISTNPLLIAVPTIALTIFNYFAHQIFPFEIFQVKYVILPTSVS